MISPVFSVPAPVMRPAPSAHASGAALHFQVVRGEGQRVGLRLEPSSTDVPAGILDTAQQRAHAVASLVSGSPAGRLNRISLATDDTHFLASRVEGRVALRVLEGHSPSEQLIRSEAGKLGSAKPPGAEYLPATGHMILGPAAARMVLGLDDGGSIASRTRAVYEVAHEAAHARQPLSLVARSVPQATLVEEARADEVARNGLTQALGSAMNVQIDPRLLARDTTYGDARKMLGELIAPTGRSLGTDSTARWLDSHNVDSLVGALATA